MLNEKNINTELCNVTQAKLGNRPTLPTLQTESSGPRQYKLRPCEDITIFFNY